MFYLASIPRSGSTLLASLLGQREDTYVSPTSNLESVLGAVVQVFNNNPATAASKCDDDSLHRIIKGIIDARYADRKEPIIFDKGRQWQKPWVSQLKLLPLLDR